MHCASGISRSVSVCMAWLMLRKKLSSEEALREVRKSRPQALPNHGFLQSLRLLETLPDLACLFNLLIFWVSKVFVVSFSQPNKTCRVSTFFLSPSAKPTKCHGFRRKEKEGDLKAAHKLWQKSNDISKDSRDRCVAKLRDRADKATEQAARLEERLQRAADSELKRVVRRLRRLLQDTNT